MGKNQTKLILLFCFIPTLAFGRGSNYCQEYGLGWNFYCQDKKLEIIEDQNQENHQAKLKALQEDLEDKKIKAIIYPTEENIKNYMLAQKSAIDKASVFSDHWRRVVWQNPTLDYTLKRPVSKIGKESFLDQRNQDVFKTLLNLNVRYGIFFLFRGDCHYCHSYSPILKSFADKYHLQILPVSMDGGFLPEWSNAKINRGNIEKIGIDINTVPATLLFDKQTQKIIPIGFGVLSHSDLEERIYALTKMEVGDAY